MEASRTATNSPDLIEPAAQSSGGPDLYRGQEVLVTVGAVELGRGVVDDFTPDGSIVWTVFDGAVPRKMFIPEDRAEFRAV